MAADYNSRIAVTQEGDAYGFKTTRRPEIHKGAIEGDRPDDEQIGNPHGEGVDEDGLPNDPIGMAEDVLGANEDETQG
jgi:hypothetical protein